MSESYELESLRRELKKLMRDVCGRAEDTLWAGDCETFVDRVEYIIEKYCPEPEPEVIAYQHGSYTIKDNVLTAKTHSCAIILPLLTQYEYMYNTMKVSAEGRGPDGVAIATTTVQLVNLTPTVSRVSEMLKRGTTEQMTREAAMERMSELLAMKKPHHPDEYCPCCTDRETSSGNTLVDDSEKEFK